MSDARLRELERRWQESGAPADWEALLREQLRTRTGLAAVTADFLERLRDFCGTIQDVRFRAVALADLSWAIGPLGRDAWALEVADEAIALASIPEHRSRWAMQRARTRVAALRRRIRGGDADGDALEYVLEWVGATLKTNEGGRLRSEDVEARTVFEDWWRALPEGDRPADLIEKGCALVRSLRPLMALQVLGGARAALVALGVQGRFVDDLRAHLTPAGLERLLADAEEFRHSVDAVRVNVQLAAETLIAFEGQPSPEDARRLCDLFGRNGSMLDEFSIDVLAVALRRSGESPLTAARRLVDAGELDDYGALLVTIAGLHAAAEVGAQRDAWPVLQAALERAWTYPDAPGTPRHRPLKALLELLPELAPEGQAVPTLDASRVRGRDSDVLQPYAANEISLAAANAVAKVGSSAALEFLGRLVDDVEAVWRPTPWNTWWLSCEVLDAVLRAARRQGDVALPLIGRVVELVDSVLIDNSARAGGTEGAFFCTRTLLNASLAYSALGDESGRVRAMASVDEISAAIEGWDLTELLSFAASVASRSRSLPLAEWTLQLAIAGRIPAGQSRFRSDLVEELARGAVAPIREVVETQ